MKTRCKFVCDSVEEHRHGWICKMSAVFHNNDKNHENSLFWKFTPSGTLNFSMDKHHYKGELPKVGEEFYLDLESLPPVAAESPVG